MNTVPGSVTKPVPGYELMIVDDENKPILEKNKLVRVVMKLPMPPACMTTLYGNE